MRSLSGYGRQLKAVSHRRLAPDLLFIRVFFKRTVYLVLVVHGPAGAGHRGRQVGAVQFQPRLLRRREQLAAVVGLPLRRPRPQGHPQEGVRPPRLRVLLVQQVQQQVLVTLD